MFRPVIIIENVGKWQSALKKKKKLDLWIKLKALYSKKKKE